MRRQISWITVLAASVSLLLPITASASVNGRRNTAIGLGAVTIYELATGHTTTGVITGAGTYYAYKRYKDAHGRKHHRQVSQHYIYVAPPGWHHGQKRGWHHGGHPPGWQRGWQPGYQYNHEQGWHR